MLDAGRHLAPRRHEAPLRDAPSSAGAGPGTARARRSAPRRRARPSARSSSEPPPTSPSPTSPIRLPDLTLTDAPKLTLEAVYFDTADLALTRSKVSLRHRTGEGAARWTLKLPKDRSGPVDLDAAVAGTLRRRREPGRVRGARSAVPPGPRSDRRRSGGVVVRSGPTAPGRPARPRPGDEIGEIDDDLVEVFDRGPVAARSVRSRSRWPPHQATNDVLPTVAAALRFAGAHEAPTAPRRWAVPSVLPAQFPRLPLGVVVDRRPSIEALVRAALATAAHELVDHDTDSPRRRRRSRAASFIPVRRLRTDLRAPPSEPRRRARCRTCVTSWHGSSGSSAVSGSWTSSASVCGPASSASIRSTATRARRCSNTSPPSAR